MADDNPFAIVARFMMPAVALTVGARLDAALEGALLAKMRKLSEAQRTNLFDGYGPLSSFAAKIDVGYALNNFDDALYADLTVIRKIRNAFAHPQAKLGQPPEHFDDDPDMVKLCKQFADYDASIKPNKLFERKVAPAVNIKRVNTVPSPRRADRHAPGYMAAYMRQWRAKRQGAILALSNDADDISLANKVLTG